MEETRFVEAIEDGKIVNVSERYALEEGLPILRKSFTRQTQISAPAPGEQKTELRKESRIDFLDKLKKPADWKEKQVLNELLENFHWHVRVERKRKGITRRHLAQMVGESEETIRTIEYGRLPVKDFVLINKIQTALKINLRKDKKDFNQPVKEMLEKQPSKTKSSKTFSRSQESTDNILGSDIEILEDEI